LRGRKKKGDLLVRHLLQLMLRTTARALRLFNKTSTASFPAVNRSKMATQKPRLVFVTGNANKLREVQQIIGDDFELVSRSIDRKQARGDFLFNLK
jgi:hypothetical protein